MKNLILCFLVVLSTYFPPQAFAQKIPEGMVLIEPGCFNMGTNKVYDYHIKNGQVVTTVPGRLDAIAKAKEMSARTWRPVGLERDDGRVKMQFRRGSLLIYRYDTHDRR